MPGGLETPRSTARPFEFPDQSPLFIAHRGYRARYPENTLAAFTHSLGCSSMIELDLRLSAEGIPVVFHDFELTRTSNAASMAPILGLTSLRLSDWRLEHLRQLDLGSWFLTQDPFGSLHRGEVSRNQLLASLPQRILTLAEVLTWALAHRMPLNLELKDLEDAKSERHYVPTVLAAIRQAGASGQVVLSSFQHHYLRDCHQLAPEIATAALQANHHPPDLLAYLRHLGVCAYHPEDAITEESLVQTLRAHGLHVNVYTVNEPARQRELFRFGVTGVFTDVPGEGGAACLLCGANSPVRNDR